MGGEKMAADHDAMNTVRDLRKVLDGRLYAEAMVARSTTASGLADALRAIDENSGVKQFLETIRNHDAATRAALGRIEGLRSAAAFDMDSSLRLNMELARQAIVSLDEVRFRLPE